MADADYAQYEGTSSSLPKRENLTRSKSPNRRRLLDVMAFLSGYLLD